MIRVLELFGGIGAFTQAMKRLNLPVEVVDYVEIDKYAVASYNAMNGTSFECQDIRQYSRGGRHDVDIIMHGSPCQDFSLAGKGRGGDEGSGTRSSLMYETVRIVSEEMPKVVIWENVKALLSAKHRHNFDAYLERLEELGYKNYYKVLNAKDYGIPQNRERIFTVSILGEHKPFEFPDGFPLAARLIDLLDKEVPESFYISEDKLEKLLTRDFYKKHPAVCKDGTVSAICSRDYKDPKCIQVGNFRDGTEAMPNPSSGRVYDPEGLSPTILSRDYKEPKCIQVGNLYGTEVEPNPCAGRVWDPDGLSPTVQTCQGGNRMPIILETDKIEVKEATKKGYDLAGGVTQ